jgi:hypothetical protein
VKSGAGGHSQAKEEEAHGRLPRSFLRCNLLLEDSSLGRTSGAHGAATSAAGGGGAEQRHRQARAGRGRVEW